ncbi:MAG: RagB/SusD family nutrient uptake outer membrane protein, partial [Mariniphaga sp.]|nr:RagB/SusD family nutrient uptake outer membrane protein [Mariniphaga sp.]
FERYFTNTEDVEVTDRLIEGLLSAMVHEAPKVIDERARNSTETGGPAAVPADRNVAETNTATVLEWIFEERRLELAFEEGHRWWDLRRRHIAGEIDLKNWNFDSRLITFNFKDYNVNFPLPDNEVVENPNMDQNEGY